MRTIGSKRTFKWARLKGPEVRSYHGTTTRKLDSISPTQKPLDFYLSPAWRKLVAAIKKERGDKCEACGAEQGQINGDHITEMQDGGAPLDPGNVQLLCQTCHSIKTRDEGQARQYRQWINRTRHLIEV